MNCERIRMRYILGLMKNSQQHPKLHAISCSAHDLSMTTSYIQYATLTTKQCNLSRVTGHGSMLWAMELAEVIQASQCRSEKQGSMWAAHGACRNVRHCRWLLMYILWCLFFHNICLKPTFLKKLCIVTRQISNWRVRIYERSAWKSIWESDTTARSATKLCVVPACESCVRGCWKWLQPVASTEKRCQLGQWWSHMSIYCNTACGKVEEAGVVCLWHIYPCLHTS